MPARTWADHRGNASQPDYTYPPTRRAPGSSWTDKGNERMGKYEGSCFREASIWGTCREQAYYAEFFAILRGIHHLESRPCSE